jgi:hypothetical protein
MIPICFLPAAVQVGCMGSGAQCDFSGGIQHRSAWINIFFVVVSFQTLKNRNFTQLTICLDNIWKDISIIYMRSLVMRCLPLFMLLYPSLFRVTTETKKYYIFETVYFD